MALSVNDTGQALALMPFDVAGWTEEEARAQFAAFRWSEYGGRPTCQRCGSDAVNRFKCRPIYKCKRCHRQFSDTSGSPWADRKLSFRKIVYLAATFGANKQARSALSLSEDLGVHYKTALLWLHKFRLHLQAKMQADCPLSGEVEVDGAEIGGFIRPKNVRKSKSDHRKVPYKAKDRTLHVVAVRQRGGGPILTFVGRSEADVVEFVKKSIMKGTTVFTDMAPHWSRLRTKFILRQVNHKLTYTTPEASTNQVETIWALLRVMGRVHRHIAQQYLDLYAAEAAWTIRKGQMQPGDGFRQIMSAMSVRGASPLAGYFQGRKRSLPICNRDGSVSEWKPDPKRRPQRPKPDGTFEPVKTRRPLAKTWKEDFSFITAAELLSNPKAVPNQPGVYALFLRDGRQFLDEAGYHEQPYAPIWCEADAAHVYSGESWGIRDRVQAHLCGNWDDTFRKSMLALGWTGASVDSSLPPAAQAVQAVADLNSWLARNVVIGFKVCGYCKDVEDAMLLASASPLNLTRPNPSAALRGLKEARQSLMAGVAAAWPSGEAPQKRRR